MLIPIARGVVFLGFVVTRAKTRFKGKTYPLKELRKFTGLVHFKGRSIRMLVLLEISSQSF